MLAVSGVEKRYGRHTALDGVCLSVARGEVVGLLGPNGAGKSTLVSIVAGLRAPDAGSVHVDGIDVVAAPARAQARIGYAPQETGVYEVLTVRENLTFFCDLGGLRGRARGARIEEVAHALELSSLLDRTAFALSGGERRRLHTAIAFLHRPALLLLDEPTVGADIETRTALLTLIRATADHGAAVVYSTHYLPEVETLHASVAMLVHGRMIATGRVDELVRAHGNAAVELSFDGPVPELDLGGLSTTVDGDVVRVTVADPATAVASVIGRLGPAASRVRSIAMVRPSLDGVFMSLTGRRYSPEGSDVVAA